MAELSDLIGSVPHKIALAGGWIDQPFMTKVHPDKRGSMVVASVVPDFPVMERSGMSGGTRRKALELWNGRLPDGDLDQLVRDLYMEENRDKPEPSGSQDMIGIIYPGINRLDFDFDYEDGYFPRHIESCLDRKIITWLESVLHVLPVGPRPDGYNPLGARNLQPDWVKRLGRSGEDCFNAITSMNGKALGESFNECMECWEFLLPDILHHHTLRIDLKGLLENYQARYDGAMYSGCGGGYLYIVSRKNVPGTFKINIRT